MLAADGISDETVEADKNRNLLALKQEHLEKKSDKEDSSKLINCNGVSADTP